MSGFVAFLVFAIGLLSPASAHAFTGIDDPSCTDAGFGCTTGGYGAANTGGWEETRFRVGTAVVDGHNCTRYAAYKLRTNGLAADPIPLTVAWGNATDWDDTVRRYLGADKVTDQPAVGAIAQWEANPNIKGDVGHVAYVETVQGDRIRITEDSYGKGTGARTINKSEVDSFIHLADVPVAPAVKPAPVSMVQIIDSSGSMTSNDPQNRRLAAATAYIAASSPEDEVGIVDFDSGARTVSAAVKVGSSRQALSDGIATIDSYGGTDLGVGLDAGFAVLSAAGVTGTKRAAIFLTDGEGTYSGQASKYAAQGWKVFPISIGTSIDAALLQQIATETGGRYIQLGAATNLVCEFQQIRAEVAGLPTSGCTPTGTIKPKETLTFLQAVLRWLKQFTFTITWPGSTVEMTITSPSGKVYTNTTADPNLIVSYGPTYATFTVLDPEPGDWTVQLYGADIPEGGEPYIFSTVSLPKEGSEMSFTDVPPGTQFYDEIMWLASTGITTGWPDGTFRPVKAINRDAMAAFLYRSAGSPAYTPPSTSPFVDVSPDTQFYKEMAWLADQKISTGWRDGTYRPLQPVNRDAMAAFLYRSAGSPAFTPPSTSPFVDVSPDTQFYKEMAWLADQKISIGWRDSTYRPLQPVNRDAMAAFLYRAEHK